METCFGGLARAGALAAVVLCAGPAHAALDPATGVLAESLTAVTIETLADLTTAPQRATTPRSVHADAVVYVRTIYETGLIWRA